MGDRTSIATSPPLAKAMLFIGQDTKKKRKESALSFPLWTAPYGLDWAYQLGALFELETRNTAIETTNGWPKQF
jgi:hypothetical protein